MSTKKIITSHSKLLLQTILSSASSPSSSFSRLTPNPRRTHAHRFLSSSQQPNNNKVNSKLVNFSPSDSDSDSDSDNDNDNRKKPDIKPKLPPPYDPFSKKPLVEDPKDPKDLQEIFHKMRTEGLFDSAAKMFDGLSKDGLTHEALALFEIIKDGGEMPEVVAHTAVLEAYSGAGKPREALRVFRRMLGSGVAPNAYTYSVLVKGLASEAGFGAEAGKFVAEMAGKGMRPNAGVCVAAVEGMVRDGRDGEAREIVERLRARGFGPHEKDVREVLKGKRGPLVRAVMSLLFDK